MKKWFLILMSVILAFPAFGSPVFAEETVVYKDGEHEIIAKALKQHNDEASGAAGFINEEALLIIEDNKGTLVITVPDNEFATVLGIQVEGVHPDVTKVDGASVMTFPLASIKSELNARVQYEVPMMNMYDQDEPFRFVLQGLEELIEKPESGEIGEDESETGQPGEEPEDPQEQPGEPVEESQEPEQPGEPVEESQEPEQPGEPGQEQEQPGVPGENPEKPGDTEEEEEETEQFFTELPDNAKYIKYISSSPATNRQFNNPAVVFEVDGKTYIQLSGTGGQFIKSLKIGGENGKEVTWGVRGPNFTVQFEHPGSLSDVLDFYMLINAGPRGEMAHVVDLSFDDNSQKPLRTSETINAQLGEKVTVQYLDTVVINDSDVVVEMPYELPDDVELIVTKEEPTNYGELIPAGSVYDFEFTNLEDFNGSFTLTMAYDTKYDSEDNKENYKVDIYYYNEATGEWIAQNGTASNGKVTVNPTHFSTYGVFAVEVEKEDDNQPQEGEVVVIAEDVEYVILHENNDEVSIADQFFTGLAKLIEVDGVKYLQIASTNPEFIVYLKSEYGEFTLVDEKEGVYQVQVPGNFELTDEFVLEMGVNVPGAYKGDHTTRLSFDVEKVEEPSESEKPTPQGPTNPAKPGLKDNNNGEKETEVKAYAVNYVVYQEDSDEVSLADQFFTGIANLIEVNGVKYLQITSTNPEYIVFLKSEYGEFTLVDEEAGVYQVQVPNNFDLADVFVLEMGIDVPGVYKAEHVTRVIFDVDTLEEVDPSGLIVPTPDSGQPVKDTKKPDKPTFGEGDKDEDKKGAAKSDQDGLNPKTGENTNVMLYLLLLIASAIPLAIQAKRRFV